MWQLALVYRAFVNQARVCHLSPGIIKQRTAQTLKVTLQRKNLIRVEWEYNTYTQILKQTRGLFHETSLPNRPGVFWYIETLWLWVGLLASSLVNSLYGTHGVPGWWTGKTPIPSRIPASSPMTASVVYKGNIPLDVFRFCYEGSFHSGCLQGRPLSWKAAPWKTSNQPILSYSLVQ